MKKQTLFTIIAAIFMAINLNAQMSTEISMLANTKPEIKSGEELIKIMCKTYQNAPCKAFTLTQKNIYFENGNVINKSIWYKSVEFPNKSRTDFDKKESGNYLINHNDSAFNFKNNKLQSKTNDLNILQLLVGGMYFTEYNQVITILRKNDFDLSLFQEKIINKKDTVYIIGLLDKSSEEMKTEKEKQQLIESDNEKLEKTKRRDIKKTSNQIWVNKSNLVITKIVQINADKEITEILFENHQKNCEGFIETKITILKNGKVEQIQEYSDIKQVKSFSNKLFKTN